MSQLEEDIITAFHWTSVVMDIFYNVEMFSTEYSFSTLLSCRKEGVIAIFLTQDGFETVLILKLL